MNQNKLCKTCKTLYKEAGLTVWKCSECKTTKKAGK